MPPKKIPVVPVTRASQSLSSVGTPPNIGGALLSRSLVYNRSSQTSVIVETPLHVVESYGTPTPVLVTEAVTVAERITEVSVKIQESGWASLVCGRSLFVWRFKQDLLMRNLASHCKELILPASDLAHKAELVYIISSREMQIPSVIAVSPEGIVRYWPNIANEGISFEAAADLQGQECYSLTSVYPLGCILATTTGSLVLIKASTIEGQHNIICMTLNLPQGVLAGIGRRLSSFIFGAMPTQSSEAKQLNKVLSAVEEDGKHSLYVLSGSLFQKWCLSADQPYKLVFELDIDRYLKEGFLDAVWNGDSPNYDLLQIKTWCLDVQLCLNGVILLTAGMNPLVPQEMCYAFAILEEQPEAPVFTSFTPIKYSEPFREQDEEKLLSYRFVFPPGSDEKAYVYSTHKIINVSVFSEVDPDVIDFGSVGNIILGAGSCGEFPLFFTQLNGLVCMRPQILEKEFKQESGVSQDSTKEGSLSESGLRRGYRDLPGKMQKAMLAHYDGNFDFCKNQVCEIKQFLTRLPDPSAVDKTVIKVSLRIIDDCPRSDPRWCESVPRGDTSSSMLILHQLEDKFKAHDHFINFLKVYDLWDKLSVLKIKGKTRETCFVLLEHAEKLVAAKVIRRFCLEHPDVADRVIRRALSWRQIEVDAPLSQQDVFFREISQVDSFFPPLLRCQNDELNSGELGYGDVLETVGSVNSMLVGVFQAVLRFRESHKHLYCSQNGNNTFKVEYIPWTSNEGLEGIRTLLLQQHVTTVRHCLNLTAEGIKVDGVIFQTLKDLIAIILDGFESQLESLKGKEAYALVKERFSSERTRLIAPLLKTGHYVKAAALAERFHDFNTLIQFCEDTDDLEKLQEYCVRFVDEGFHDFLYQWYIEKGKYSRIFKQPFFHHESLEAFLLQHQYLRWLHNMRVEDYPTANSTLKELGIKEKRFLSKKKTLLSLSKLSALASEWPTAKRKSEVEALNVEQELVVHQETLPGVICENLSLDIDSARVLSPGELIELYISEENTEANQYDFRIALDLLKFIPKLPTDSYFNEMRQKIWCRAIQRDSWTGLEVSDPVAAVKKTVFFLTIELAFYQGVNLEDFLPPIEFLMQNPEIRQLNENAPLTFFIGAIYEHFENLGI